MNNKIALSVVVLLAISFVNSLPQLRDLNENSQMLQLLAYVRTIDGNAIKTALAKVDSSEESDETDWQDSIFDMLFATDESDEEITEFGPEFNINQFVSRLNVDLGNAYRRKCKKISGNDDTYDKIQSATKDLGKCLKEFSKSEEFKSNVEAKDAQSLIRNVCSKRDIPIKCIEKFMAVDDLCSFPSEIEVGHSSFRILRNTLELLCENDGNDLISLAFGKGQECFPEKKSEIFTCANKALYEIVKGFLVKLIEYEDLDNPMNTEDCKTYDETSACFVSAVENCVDPTPKKVISSLFQIVRNETDCAKLNYVATNLLN